jgi:hypothetical protein
MPRPLRVSCLALVLFLISAHAAAADTVSISYGADPTEEVPTRITATWNATEPNVRLIVTSKAVPQGCGVTYAGDDAPSTDVINRVVGASGSAWRDWTLANPGTLTLCAYLQRVDNAAPLGSTGPVLLTYRSARASVALQVPPRVTAGQIFKFYVPVSAELRRHLEVTLKPSGSRGCGADYQIDDPVSRDVIYTSVRGDHRYAKSIKAPSVDGIYLLCAYVSERPSDPAPEATASATFEVGPDLCAEARAKLEDANRAAGRAQAAAKRYGRHYRRDMRRAQRTHGARHRAYRRLAKREKKRHDRAIRARDAARNAAASAQSEVTAAC